VDQQALAATLAAASARSSLGYDDDVDDGEADDEDLQARGRRARPSTRVAAITIGGRIIVEGAGVYVNGYMGKYHRQLTADGAHRYCNNLLL
jgi:hypothetical protein